MKKTPALVGLLLATLLLGACGNDTGEAEEATSQAAEQVNGADVTFAEDMIPHHEQAVEMAEMASDRASSSEVKGLAADIEAAQGPEIEQLSAWLQAWGEDPPSEPMDHGDMGHGEASSMSGMMTQEDMSSLGGTSGDQFDQMWLEMMIEHHRGAVDMAESAVADAEHPGVIEMAEDIIETQQAEIAQMEELLGR